MKKRFLSVILSAMLVVSPAITPVLAIDGESSFSSPSVTYICDDFTYELFENGTAKITGYFGTGLKLEIPEEIDGYKVSAIDGDIFQGFDYCDVFQIKIPAGITEIPENLFSNIQVSKLIIPSTVTTIKSLPTDNDKYLSLEIVYDGTESQWNKLVEGLEMPKNCIVHHKNNPNLGNYDTDDWWYVLLDDGTAKLIIYIPYRNNPIEIPEEIEGYKVSAIDGDIFRDLRNFYIWSLKIPDSITEIPENTFLNVRVDKLIIPSTVTTIKSLPTNDDLYLLEIVYDGTESQWNKLVEGLEMPNNCIVHHKNNSTLEPPTPGNLDEWWYVLLDDGTAKLTIYNPSVIDNCIEIPEEIDGYKVSAIDGDIFEYGDFGVFQIKIPDCITEIPENLFSNIRVSKLIIPSTVTTIKSLPKIGLYSPFEVVYDGTESQWNKLVEDLEMPKNCIVHHKNNPTLETPAPGYFDEWWYMLLDDGTAKLTYYYSSGCMITCVEIPEEIDGYKVSAIDGDIFRDLRYFGVFQIKIPDCITEIPENLFSNIRVSKLIIPSTVTTIKSLPTNDDLYLLEIVYDGTESQWNKLVEDLEMPDFYPVHHKNNPTLETPAPGYFDEWWYMLLDDGTAKLTYYYSSGGMITGVEIPEEIDGYKVSAIDGDISKYLSNFSIFQIKIPDCITEIPENLFSNIRVSKLIIPSTVTTIKSLPTDNDLYLSLEIVYDGTESQWNKLVEGLEMPKNCIVHHKNNPNLGNYDTDDWWYVLLDDGTAKLIIYNPSGIDNRIEIPEEIDGYKVSAIDGDIFKYLGDFDVFQIKIPDCITEIPENLFSNIRVSKLIIPSTVTTIKSLPTYNDLYLSLEIVYDGTESQWNKLVEGLEMPKNCIVHHKNNPTLETPAPGYFDEWWYMLLDDGTAKLTYYYSSGCMITCVEIPEEIDGYKVSAIDGDIFRDLRYFGVFQIKIPDCITEIPENLFSNIRVSKLIIPSTVTTIKSLPTYNDLYLSLEIVYDGTESQWNKLVEGLEMPKNCIVHHKNNPTLETPAPGYFDEWWYMLLDDGTAKLIMYNPSGIDNRIEIPEEIDGYKVSAIDGDIFKYLGDFDVFQIKIPAGITEIPDGAFYDCTNLRELVITGDITEIGENAFNSENLTIYYFGTETQWDNIKIHPNNKCISKDRVKFITGDLIIGDVNVDGVVDIDDVTVLQLAIAHYIDYTDFNYYCYDFNNDGYVNIKDATAIQEYLLNNF